MKNEFSKKTRELFTWNYACWECSQNGWDCLHHILARQDKNANSPLNACPIHNFKCHQPEGRKHMLPIHDDRTRAKFLQKTMRWLLKEGYELTEKDLEFYQDNIKYYERRIE